LGLDVGALFARSDAPAPSEPAPTPAPTTADKPEPAPAAAAELVNVVSQPTPSRVEMVLALLEMKRVPKSRPGATLADARPPSG